MKCPVLTLRVALPAVTASAAIALAAVTPAAATGDGSYYPPGPSVTEAHASDADQGVLLCPALETETPAQSLIPCL
jgi:hypothetical protein